MTITAQYTKDVDPKPDPDTKEWTRLAGDNRYAINAEVVEDGEWETGGVVVLATGDKFPDALSASALAGVKNAPIVLTQMSDELSTEAREIIERLKLSQVYVLGDTFTIGAGQDAEIKAMGMGTEVSRVEGNGRTATAYAAYEEVKGDLSDVAVVTWSDNFADALSIAPAAYRYRMPIFLTDTDANLRDTYINAIIRGNFTKVWS